jgi:hypothetical protein
MGVPYGRTYIEKETYSPVKDASFPYFPLLFICLFDLQQIKYQIYAQI